MLSTEEKEYIPIGLYYLLLEAFGEEMAKQIEGDTAYADLVHRMEQLVEAGEEPNELLRDLDEYIIQTVPTVKHPAALLEAAFAAHHQAREQSSEKADQEDAR